MVALIETTANIGLSEKRIERAYGILNDAVVQGKLMGAALQVGRKGAALPPACFGRRQIDRDGKQVESDTIFLVASVTKPIVATAVMLLVERGKLSLDDRVVDIVPEFGGQGKEKVQIRHLLTHTSGLPDQLDNNMELRARKEPLETFVEQIFATALLFEPGTQISYQSCGFALLGEVLERIEGVSLRTFLRREIFDPLGMDDTSLGVQEDRLGQVAEIAIPGGDFEYGLCDVDWNWNSTYWRSFGAPWGGLLTTVRDMTALCQMLLNEGRIGEVDLVSSATVAAMTADQTSAMPNLSAQERLRERWGLGWGLKNRTNSKFGDLTSEGTYGHTGVTGTMIWMDPKTASSCVLLTNDPEGGVQVRRKVSNAVAAALLRI